MINFTNSTQIEIKPLVAGQTTNFINQYEDSFRRALIESPIELTLINDKVTKFARKDAFRKADIESSKEKQLKNAKLAKSATNEKAEKVGKDSGIVKPKDKKNNKKRQKITILTPPDNDLLNSTFHNPAGILDYKRNQHPGNIITNPETFRGKIFPALVFNEKCPLIDQSEIVTAPVVANMVAISSRRKNRATGEVALFAVDGKAKKVSQDKGISKPKTAMNVRNR